MEQEKGFYWERHARVEKFFLKNIDQCRKESTALARFEARLVKQTDTRLLDWIDHLILPDSTRLKDTMDGLGFTRITGIEVKAYLHPGVLLPAIVLADRSADLKQGVALRVESISDFLQVNNMRAEIEGQPLAPFRRAVVAVENDWVVLAVERRGTRDFVPTSPGDRYGRDYLEALEAWQNIPRGLEDEEQAWADLKTTVDNLVRKLGPDTAAHIVCLGERFYWQSRNYAARVQKGRQDTLGLGWANHDHHTFRSSRHNFAKLISLFSRLGFERRERFYAGEEAGWGAQVMENSAAGLVLFLDVDLDPEEVDVDFSQTELPARDRLGTVGLWCGLHGDSILKAGMHHLAARFDFDLLREDIARFGVRFMAPFSDFSYLRQAFSVAENWRIELNRLHELVARRAITSEQAERFSEQGAVGSHLENIQRQEGYKGFNKKNVSAIIRETDPRKGGD